MSSAPRIFISYRRQDAAGYAGRIYDALGSRFGVDRIFMDVDGIPAGSDFVERMQRALASCTVLLVLIGPEWSSATDARGELRLASPDDYVRLEVTTGLERGIAVLPVLLGDADMPPAEQLPDPLRRLSRLSAVELRHSRWQDDLDRLAELVAARDPSLLEPQAGGGQHRVSAALVALSDRVARRVGGWRRLRTALVLAIAAVAAIVANAMHGAGIGRSLELSTIDTRFAIRGPQPPPDDLLIVAIDPRTFETLETGWPLDRRLHATLIDRLRRAGAAAIVYDVDFSTPREGDTALKRAIQRVRTSIPVTLGTGTVGPNGETLILGGDDELRRIGARPAFAGFEPEPGGVFRRVTYEGYGLKSIGVVASESVLARSIPPSWLGGDSAWVNYHGPPGTIPSVSFVDVLRDRVASARLKGRVIIVGVTDPAIGDIHPVSTTASGGMAGAEIHANAFDSIRRRRLLHSMPQSLESVLVVAAAFAVPLLVLRLRLLPVLASAAALLAGYALAAQLAFGSGTVMPVVSPVLAFALGGGLVLAAQLIAAAVLRRAHRPATPRRLAESRAT